MAKNKRRRNDLTADQQLLEIPTQAEQDFTQTDPWRIFKIMGETGRVAAG